MRRWGGGKRRGPPPSCPAEGPPASLPARAGGAAAAIPPSQTGSHSPLGVRARRSALLSHSGAAGSCQSPLPGAGLYPSAAPAPRWWKGGAGWEWALTFIFFFFFAVSSNFSTCKQPSSCPAGGEVMSAGRALPSWHNAGLKGTAGAPTGGPRAAAAAHRRAGAEPFRLSAERAAIKLSVWDE